MTTTELTLPSGISAVAQEPRVAEPMQWAPLLVVLAGVFMTTLDFFIVNVAIPSLQTDLHAGSAAVQFVVAGFGLAFAAGMISAGRFGDLWGRRRIFSIGMALFTLSSALCGVAPSAATLIGARVVQGVAAALILPQVLAILSTVYDGPRRVRAFSAYGLTLGCAGVFGQLIGGGLIRLDVLGLGWRAIFLINVPVGVAALAMARRVLPESRSPIAARLDPIGAVLITATLVALVLPLVEGRAQGWPTWTYVCLAGSAVLAAITLLHQRGLHRVGGAPTLALGLFRDRAFVVGALAGLVYALATASFFLVLALYLQQGQGLTPLASGVIFVPLGIGYFLVSAQSGKVAARIGAQVIALGGVVTAAGYLLLGETAAHLGDASVLWLLPGLIVAGAGLGLVMAPLPTITLQSVPVGDAAAASGVLSTAQQVGGALGVAVVGIVFFGAGTVPVAFSHSLALLAAFPILAGAVIQFLRRASR